MFVSPQDASALVAQIAYSAAPLDRAGLQRNDAETMAACRDHPDVQVLLFQDGRPLAEAERGQPAAPGALLWLGPLAFDLAARSAPVVFLGLDDQAKPYFAVDLGRRFSLDDSPIAGLGEFADMRAITPRLSASEANLAATARALFEWHRRHGYCANCGSPTDIVEAGWKRACPDCGAEHFPRTDAVAIMLPVHDGACLLGRQAGWPEGMFSCLAGFVEPGETLEEAARRETFEEAGIKTGAVQYLFCQPWPYPSSLMVGMIAEAKGRDLTLAEAELDDARWFTKDEAQKLLAGDLPGLWCPPPMAIAHQILKAWAEG